MLQHAAQTLLPAELAEQNAHREIARTTPFDLHFNAQTPLPAKQNARTQIARTTPFDFHFGAQTQRTAENFVNHIKPHRTT
jgi:hypothetical protein